MKFFRVMLVLTVFLLLFCSLNAYADFGDEVTLGGQDSDGYYRWRVTSDGHLRPGNTDGDVDLGTSAAPVGEIHSTTMYVSSGFSAQGKVASEELSGSAITVSLTYGIHAITSSAGTIVTVPDGSYAGETITIMVETDGGHAIVTPTTCTGFTSLNLDAALDQVTLRWISSTYGWILVGQYGATPE